MLTNILKIGLSMIIVCALSMYVAANHLPPNEEKLCHAVKSLLNKKSAIKTVVLDAGHGGKDSGCTGFQTQEKAVALHIALKLGALINYYHPEVEVVYTRKTDVFIPLFKRAEIANRNNADLFISIHCNAIAGGNAHGTETYVMGLHTAQENLEVAKRENASILLEDDYLQNYDGYNPHSPEGHIILSMVQNAYLDRSIQFADKVEKSFQLRTGMKSRGVKQAGFVVLRKTTMPSVLVEAGFLSEKGDEHLLKTEEGQDKVAQALIKAFTEYKRELDKNYNYAESTIADQASRESNNAISSATQSSTRGTYTSTDPNVSHTSVSHTDVSHTNTSIRRSNTTTRAQVRNTASDQNAASPPSRRIVQEPIVYKVQIAAARNKRILVREGKWKKITDLDIRKEQDMYKYLTGHFYFIEEAEELRAEMLRMGFKGAFIVGYQNNIRLKI